MNQLWTIAGPAALGAAVQELIYWYNLRHQLDEERYQRLIASKGYWIVVGAFVIGAALSAMVWFAGGEKVSHKESFIFGVGLPLLIKQLGLARGSKVTLGHRERNYLEMK